MDPLAFALAAFVLCALGIVPARDPLRTQQTEEDARARPPRDWSGVAVGARIVGAFLLVMLPVVLLLRPADAQSAQARADIENVMRAGREFHQNAVREMQESQRDFMRRHESRSSRPTREPRPSPISRASVPYVPPVTATSFCEADGLVCEQRGGFKSCMGMGTATVTITWAEWRHATAR